MAGLKQIKSKIRSIDKTRTVTKAMEAVSAAKMRRAQERALAARAYAAASAAVLARVASSRELRSHPLAQVREVNNALYIVITADRGLAGALNSAVLRAAYADLSARALPREKVKIIAVGRKANEFFAKRGFAIMHYHENADDRVSSEAMQEILDEAARAFAVGEVDLVKICYQNFLTTFEQRPTVRQIFPLSLVELQKVVGSITPRRGRYAEASNGSSAHETLPAQVVTYSIEPSEEEILNAILPRLAGIFVYHALLESKASEHSARMVAMKSASDKGAELSHELKLQFNKARQAAITREVSEITGGMEAMAG